MLKTDQQPIGVIASLKMIQFIINGSNSSSFNDITFYDNLRKMILERAYFQVLVNDENDLMNKIFDDKEMQGNVNPIFHDIFIRQNKVDVSNIKQRVEEEDYKSYTDSIYLLNISSEECAKIRNKYNVACYGPDDIDEARFLFAHELITIGEKESAASMKNISNFSRYQHNFNELIIIDNYFELPVKKKKEEKYKMGHISKVIKEINISNKDNEKIIKIYTKFEEQIDRIDIEKIKDTFENILKVPCKIELFNLEEERFNRNHDRNILTDYVWINSGTSFHSYNIDKNTKRLTSGTFTTMFITGKGCKTISFDHCEEGPSNDFCWAIEGYSYILDNINEIKPALIS